jgi:hypothetical protein
VHFYIGLISRLWRGFWSLKHLLIGNVCDIYKQQHHTTVHFMREVNGRLVNREPCKIGQGGDSRNRSESPVVVYAGSSIGCPTRSCTLICGRGDRLAQAVPCGQLTRTWRDATHLSNSTTMAQMQRLMERPCFSQATMQQLPESQWCGRQGPSRSDFDSSDKSAHCSRLPC